MWTNGEKAKIKDNKRLMYSGQKGTLVKVYPTGHHQMHLKGTQEVVWVYERHLEECDDDDYDSDTTEVEELVTLKTKKRPGRPKKSPPGKVKAVSKWSVGDCVKIKTKKRRANSGEEGVVTKVNERRHELRLKSGLTVMVNEKAIVLLSRPKSSQTVSQTACNRSRRPRRQK
jgi:hypothetical protein